MPGSILPSVDFKFILKTSVAIPCSVAILANSILKLSSYKNKIQTIPKNVYHFFDDYDYIICFDLRNDIDLKNMSFKNKNFLYITKKENLEFTQRFTKNFKVNCIYRNELSIYNMFQS